ncbi:MAG TPA: prepilin-type N-terminal cleavage/methylation domain-containing protein [Patescibacteria group bacterium]|nr:prepilin-type N-terminal cleavage/methylation domain-containing protein [Patescibacteria group bacterium]
MIGDRSKQNGFTILELMIATTVFSVVLLVAGSGIIAIGRMYYKSITSSRVQEVARSAMDDVTRSLQFSSGIVAKELSGSIKVRCFGEDRYTYVINEPLTGSAYGLKQDKTPAEGCSLGTPAAGTTVPPNAKQLLGSGMRLMQFYVSDGVDGVFKVNIKVAYGDNDLLSIYDEDGNEDGWVPPAPEATAASALCRGGPGNSFCSVSGLETLISSRID